MLRLIEPDAMRMAEQAAFDAGISPLLLMENAARAAFDVLRDMLGGSCRGKRVLFLCGAGNNGGDGLAMARLLLARGGMADVALLCDAKTPEAIANLQHLRALERDGQAIEIFTGVPDHAAQRQYDAVVDALFGTGFRGALAADCPAAALLAWGNAAAPVLAIDIPSGMDGATGAVAGVCAHAQRTVTFHRPKLGLYLTEHRDWVGQVIVADIGLPACFDAPEGIELPEQGDLARLLPARSVSAHKGVCGRVAIYAGSMGMAGAAAMAARAALRAGAGLTTVVCPREIMPILQQSVPNATCLAQQDLSDIRCDALLLGCGIAENEQSYDDLLHLKALGVPQVWDAGALNLLAARPFTLGAWAVMTPHMGEAARLLGWDIARVLSDKPAAAQALRAKYGCNVVLKSSVTLLLTADGQQCALNAVGSPALAKGGSGDALAGILAALLGQGLPIFDAMRAACLWFGMAGCLAARRFGVRSALTGDVIDCLGAAEQGTRTGGDTLLS